MAKFLGSRPEHREWMLVVSDDYEYSQKNLENMVEAGQLVWIQLNTDYGKTLDGITAMQGLEIIKVYRDWWERVK